MRSHYLEELRLQLEEKDRQIVQLLNDRAKIAGLIGEAKKAMGREVYDPVQEVRVLARLQAFNHGPLSMEYLRDIFREILSCCRAIQEPARVAFLGPQGSFSHLAAMTHFGQASQFVDLATIQDVFRAAETGHAQWAVVPIENSAEGSVKATLDGLVSTTLKVRGEVSVRITHCLLSKAHCLEPIERVYSHPQGLAQCQRWLKEHLPGRQLVEVSSTSEGALRAARDPQGAAVASRLSARLHNIQVLAEAIEDSPANTTRFLVLGKGQSESTGNDKTSLLFGTKHLPGALCRALWPLARERVNLLRIESYPIRDRAWHYMFLADIQGHESDVPVSRALQEMEEEVTLLRVLGSYPRDGRQQ